MIDGLLIKNDDGVDIDNTREHKCQGQGVMAGWEMVLRV